MGRGPGIRRGTAGFPRGLRRPLLPVLLMLAIQPFTTTPVMAQQSAEVPDAAPPAVSPGFTSDRPGFASTTGTAPVARLTAELGVAATLDTPKVLSLPNASLRVGVLDWAELRLRGMNALWSFPDGGDTSFGIGDLIAGMKLGGSPFDGFAIATVIELRLPTATDGFGLPEVVPTVELVADITATPWLSFTLNAFASAAAFTDETLMEVRRMALGGASVKVVFTPIAQLSVYGQSFFVGDERSATFVAFGLGASYMIVPNVQVDASFDSRDTDTGLPPIVSAGTTVLF